MRPHTTTFFVFAVAILACASSASAQHEHHGHEVESAADFAKHDAANTIWTCSMHPQIRLPKPGKCPLCHMDLIPVDAGSSSASGPSASVELSETAMRLIDLEVSTVERKWVERESRLVGKIDYDETRVKHLTAWVPGRIERLFVDYTGIEVREDDHMVALFSPQLVSAQEELIQAARSLERIKDGSELVKRSSARTLEAARAKLKLLGLTASQVAQIERRGKAEDSVTIYAPMGGTVVEKQVNEGMYVQTGSRIYTIADLSHLWLNLDAYESDLPWIRYGQQVEFTAEARPGETFHGVVSFVQPFLSEKTRTVKVRVNVENTSKRLKPGMFVTAVVKSQIDDQGNVLAPALTGKYVCPMHPEVVSDSPGSCSVCGMDLVKAERLPFVDVGQTASSRPPLVIPASAPLITGTRAIVYVKHRDMPHFEGREIALGPRAGDYYLVKNGLHEGEQVVTKGAFKLDADLQIRGAKSMMNPAGGNTSTGHQH